MALHLACLLRRSCLARAQDLVKTIAGDQKIIEMLGYKKQQRGSMGEYTSISFIMHVSITSLLFAAAALANPIALIEDRAHLIARQSTQQVNIQASLTEAQFKTLENPNTLKAYLQARGYNYNINYNQLSQGVVAIDQYFANKASQTTSTSSTDGFPAGAAAPQTTSKSTSLRGGNSYTNSTMSADTNLVSIFTFSDGNAAVGAGAIQRTQTSSSTSSSGLTNSTSTVTGGQTVNRIQVYSTVGTASDSRTVNGSPSDAMTAGSCAALSNGASARASITSTLTVPVNVTTPAQSVMHVANAFCEAGVARDNQGNSIGSVQGVLTNGGVAALVSCNGAQTRGTPNVVFNVNIQGTYSSTTGFKGTFVGSRTASVSASCN